MQITKEITRTNKTYKELFFEANEHRNLDDVEFVYQNADFKLLQALTSEKNNLQALFSLLNVNRSKPLKIISHITCFASGGHFDAGSFIQGEGTIFSLNTKVPSKFVAENAVKTDTYKNITAVYKTYRPGFFFCDNTKLKFNKPITKLNFKINKGDVVTLMECDTVQEKFTSSKNQELVLKGKINEAQKETVLTPVGVEHDESKLSSYHHVYDYKLLFDDIDVENYYKTHTDIGGKWLCINGHKIAHLGNGFGDGTYTMRFSKGKLVR